MRHRSLLCIFSHPDDEVSFSGMVMECVQAKIDVSFVCATNGQARIPNNQHNNFRKEQMRNAANLLGIRNLIFLDWEDGRLATDYDLVKMEEKIIEIIKQVQPDVIATFPPDGITLHPDHIAIHHLTKNAFLKTLHSDRPQKLYYWCRMEEEFLKKFRKEVPYKILERRRWQLTDVIPTKKLDVRKHLNRKLEALFCHEGQRLIRYLRELDREKQETFLGSEYFHLAYPNV